jgi:hypothetical protein
MGYAGITATEPFQRLTTACRVLGEMLLKKKLTPSDSVRIQAARTLIDLEAFKREMKGIPRLAAHKISDLPIKQARTKPLTLNAARAAGPKRFQKKESLEPAPTVTAPPPPTGANGGE